MQTGKGSDEAAWHDSLTRSERLAYNDVPMETASDVTATSHVRALIPIREGVYVGTPTTRPVGPRRKTDKSNAD